MMDVHQLPEMGIGAILIWIVNRLGALESRMDAMMSTMGIPAPKRNKKWKNSILAALVLGSILLASGCGLLQPVTQ